MQVANIPMTDVNILIRNTSGLAKYIPERAQAPSDQKHDQHDDIDPDYPLIYPNTREATTDEIHKKA